MTGLTPREARTQAESQSPGQIQSGRFLEQLLSACRLLERLSLGRCNEFQLSWAGETRLVGCTSWQNLPSPLGATRQAASNPTVSTVLWGQGSDHTPPGPVVPLGRIRSECLWGRRVSGFCFKAKGLWRTGTFNTKGPEEVALGSQVAKMLPGSGVCFLSWSLWRSLSRRAAMSLTRACGRVSLVVSRYVSSATLGVTPFPSPHLPSLGVTPASVGHLPFLCLAVQQPKPKHKRTSLLDKQVPRAHSESG